MLSRIIYGARVSMIVSLSATGLSVAISTLIGVTSGFFGRRYDIVVQRLVDAWMCFPGLFIILSLMAVLGQGLFQVILVIGLQAGVGGSRVVRSAVIAIRENTYIVAAKAIGAPNGRIIIRHILPNIMATLIILFSLGLGGAILMESTISFLGFGVPPPYPSWGGMLSGTGQAYMLQAPLLAVWPGLALAIVVYGMNMLGDALRDILDPRLRGTIGRYGGAKLRRGTAKTQDKETKRA